jgi:hypothetical protein
MSTTKPLPPNENYKYVFKDVMIRDPKEVAEEKKLLAKEKYLNRNSIFKSYNFIKSHYGELRYATLLNINNSIKNHCLDSCFNDETKNILQSEKLCLLNCVQESEYMFEGFLEYKEKELNYHLNGFELDKTVPIKKI